MRHTPEMLYAIICYGDEKKVRALSKEKNEQLMATLGKVNQKLMAEKKMGPLFQLMTTGSAKTLRASDQEVLDGPFAETKEQLLGVYVVSCESLDDALDVARQLEEPRIQFGVGGLLEVRALQTYHEGTPL
jgi:hypothetical protein